MKQGAWRSRVNRWVQHWFQQQPPDHYTYQEGKLVHIRGDAACETIDPHEIDSWWVDREQVHDIVHIRLRSGRVFDWLDAEYDLLPLLTRCGVCAPQEAELPARPTGDGSALA